MNPKRISSMFTFSLTSLPAILSTTFTIICSNSFKPLYIILLLETMYNRIELPVTMNHTLIHNGLHQFPNKTNTTHTEAFNVSITVPDGQAALQLFISSLPSSPILTAGTSIVSADDKPSFSHSSSSYCSAVISPCLLFAFAFATTCFPLFP